MNSIDKRFSNILSEREKDGNMRTLKGFENKVDFFSNDYLGLSKVDYDISVNSFSGTGSRLISGTSRRILEIETYVAEHFNAESALIFNSGYDANIGLLSSVPKRNDTIIYDELVHASARDGIRLSLAKAYSFKHNDIGHLEELIQKATGEIFIVVESLYSMDGDFAPIEELVRISDNFNANIILDEAHSGGIIGGNGRGLSEEFNLEDKIFARTFTFGKAFGSHGACVLGSRNLIDYLTNFARSFIYTTALPEHSYERIFSVLKKSNFANLQESLLKNISLFTNNHEVLPSPIQNIQFKSIIELEEKEALLVKEGFAVKAIYAPTVKEGRERLRICIHSFNTEDDILRIKTLLA